MDLATLLNQYEPLNEEVDFKIRMLALLKYPNCFERSLLHAHFTGSAWVVDHQFEHTLLTHHAKLNKWLQLGGHADGQKDLIKVSRKELEEESGRTAFSLMSAQIFDIDIHSIPEHKGIPAHDHYDVRFLFQGNADVEPIKNHESKEVAWVPMGKVADLTQQNVSILRMMDKTLKLKNSL